MMQSKTVKLRTGHEMPCVGLGTYLIKDEKTIFDVIDAAFEAGYRAIDTAQMYENEKYIGNALEKLLPKHNLKREDIFITTKLATYNQGEKATAAIEESLKALKLNYLDLLIIHWPGTKGLDGNDRQNITNRAESWAIMEKFQKEGKLQNIGVSNYMIKHLEPMMNDNAVRIKPAVNQCEFHPYLYTKDLLDYCKQNGIQFEAYSSLGSAEGFKELMADPTIKSIADKHKVTTAKVLLKWPLQHGVVIIPKSSNPSRVKDNIQLFDFELDSEDMAKLDGLNKDKRWCWNPNTII